tara:strand:- start:37 stop:405 length:369 start_codon:yes stop_codon:yes gene_type:complete
MTDFKYGIVVKNSKIPFLLSWFINISAITLYPFIIFREEPDIETINHERIHILQQKELLVIFFYLLYSFFWIKNKLKGQSNLEAYLNIPFEKEAYSESNNPYYILTRNKFSWINFLRDKNDK